MVKKIYKILFIILILFALELIIRNDVYAASIDSIKVYVESGTIYKNDGTLLKKGNEITGDDILVERNSAFSIKVRYDCHLGVNDGLERDVIESNLDYISDEGQTMQEDEKDKDGIGTGDYYEDKYYFKTKSHIQDVELKILSTIYFSDNDMTGTWGATVSKSRTITVKIGKSEREQLIDIENNMDNLVRGKIIEKEIEESFSQFPVLYR